MSAHQISMFSKPKVRMPRKIFKERVFDEIKAKPGTDDELSKRLRRAANSVRPRRIDLEREGRIRSVETRKLPNGRKAKIWEVVPPQEVQP